MADQAPLFIIGTGRSGTTIFHDVLAEHPDLAWITNYSQKMPSSRLAMKVGRLRHLPGVARLGARKIRPRPVEAYAVWDSAFPGFSSTIRDLTADDAEARSVKKLQALATNHVDAQKRLRFLAKYTGWPRIGFLDVAFPNAQYVHVLRDGRAVAYSLLTVPWWHGWQGPEQWRWGPLSEEESEAWERSQRSYAVLAGIQWTRVMDCITRVGRALGPDRYREVRYEDFTSAPMGCLQEVSEWAGLPMNDTFRQRVEQFGIDSRNSKWKERLPESQVAALEEYLAPHLSRYGYA